MLFYTRIYALYFSEGDRYFLSQVPIIIMRGPLKAHKCLSPGKYQLFISQSQRPFITRYTRAFIIKCRCNRSYG